MEKNRTSTIAETAVVVHVDDAGFEREVLRSSLPVLVDFWAPWCGPCRLMGPVMDELSRELQGKVKVVKINVNDNPIVANALKIQAIPMLAVFDKGNIVTAAAGLRPKQDILSLLHQVI